MIKVWNSKCLTNLKKNKSKTFVSLSYVQFKKDKKHVAANNFFLLKCWHFPWYLYGHELESTGMN